MEKYLEDLKKEILKKYKTDANVIVYPLQEDKVGYFQVHNGSCRVLVFDKNPTNKIAYGYNGNQLKEIHCSSVDIAQKIIYNESDASYVLSKLAFTNRKVSDDLYDIVSYLISTFSIVNHRLLRNLIDSEIINNYNDIHYIPYSARIREETNIKNTFGVPARYLRGSSDLLKRVSFVRELYKLNYSADDCLKIIQFFGYNDRIYTQPYMNKKIYNYVLALPQNCSSNYIDYLNMRYSCRDYADLSSFPECPHDGKFERIKDLHDKLVNIHSRWLAAKAMEENKEKNERYKKVYYDLAKEFEFKDETFSIVACKDLEELIIEGKELHHCVGSYISSVSDGSEYILFLRRNDELDKPFFTIDVLPDKKVRQIHGYSNCNMNKEIEPFIKKWAKEFKLDITNTTGRLCHV